MTNKIQLEKGWLKLLKGEFDKPYMVGLKQFLLSEESQGKSLLPDNYLWFSALNNTSFNDVKVVILGQDPYPTKVHAHGLCFSVMPEVKPLPKSLLNINKELLDDLGVDNSHTGYLQPWASQGVLLLNAVLTVEQGNTNSHQGKGWEEFTDAVVQVINEQKEQVVFILWGAYAQKKGAYIDQSKHCVIKSSHPSPLSAYRGFFGSKPFSRANEYLSRVNQAPVDWSL